MTLLRSISIVAGLLVTGGRAPPRRRLRIRRKRRKEAPKAKAPGREAARGRQQARSAATPQGRRHRRPPPPTPVAAFDDPNVDLVYGAYQRGLYKTAFDLATKRAQFNADPKAMTMLGELYANALGVKRDYAKAAEWYKRAADAGDREACSRSP